MSTICLKLFYAIIIVRLCYWVFLFSKLIRNDDSADYRYLNDDFSIVICVKNGMRFLTNLSAFKNQDGKSSLIVVDDFSDQETKESLAQLTFDMQLLHAQKDIKGKKNALTTGIKAAESNNLVLSDIDCRPTSKNWASIMVSKLNGSTEIVLGYGAHEKMKGFLNKFIRFETLMTAIQMMSYAKAGLPYMGVGRNLAYKKSLFEKTNGLSAHEHIPSGDDDLFIKEAATRSNTDISLNKESFTYSTPANSWSAFFNQKMRHISTSTEYKLIHQILLSIYAASHIGFYVCMICLLICGQSTFIFEGYLLFIIVSFVVFAIVSKKFEEQDLIFWFPILDFLFFLYLLFLTPFLFFRKQSW